MPSSFRLAKAMQMHPLNGCRRGPHVRSNGIKEKPAATVQLRHRDSAVGIFEATYESTVKDYEMFADCSAVLLPNLGAKV